MKKIQKETSQYLEEKTNWKEIILGAVVLFIFVVGLITIISWFN